MTFLPIVRRELQVAARRRSTFWGRTTAGLLGVVVGGWVVAFESVSQWSSLGTILFGALSGLCFLYCLLAGMTYSSDSISVERREGTLGLLFLTDLKGYDVVLGKLAASSLTAFYRLLAVLPIIAVALLLGGVTAAEYGRMVLVLLSTLGLSLGAGMLSSVFCESARKAAGTSLLLMIAASALCYILLGLGVWLGERFGYGASLSQSRLMAWLTWESPFMAFTAAFSSYPNQQRWIFWLALSWTVGWGLGFLLLASWRLPHVWQTATQADGRLSRLARLEHWWLRGDEGRHAWRRARLDENPITWLNSRRISQQGLVWGVLGAGAVLFALAAREIGWKDVTLHMLTSIVVHTLLKFWIASEAPRRFHEDRRSGAMELYLATPLTVPSILSGMFRSLWRSFAAPIGAVLAMDFVFVLSSDISSGDRPSFLTFWFLRAVSLPLDGVALAYVGMRLGMTSRKTRDTGSVVIRVLGYPYLLLAALATGLAILSRFGELPSIPGDGLVFWLWVWGLLGTGNSVLWWFFSRRSLLEHFREWATQSTSGKEAAKSSGGRGSKAAA